MNWRERLDARIDRCPECDEWRWDRLCIACTTPVDDGLSLIASKPEALPDREEAA